MLKLCTVISFKNSSRSCSKRESPKHREKMFEGLSKDSNETPYISARVA